MSLPREYQWLQSETAPRHLLKALELYGTREIVGAKHNPVIMGWAKEVGLDKIYTSDEVPWCGLYAAVVMQRAGRPIVEKPLWALSWSNFGVASPKPMLGDILTFRRQGGGHVGFYIAEDPTTFHVLGGNQGNTVSIVRILKTRLHAARRPQYNLQPANVRSVLLAANGIISTNEA